MFGRYICEKILPTFLVTTHFKDAKLYPKVDNIEMIWDKDVKLIWE